MIAILSSFYILASWYSGSCEGWYYFQEEEQREEMAPAILEEEKQLFHETLSTALLAPTPENIQRYQTLALQHQTRSAKFAAACERERQ